MTFTINMIAIVMILVVIAMVVYFAIKQDLILEESDYEDEYVIDSIVNVIKDTFNNILNNNISELNLNKDESLKRERQKSRLSKALRSCSFGDIGEKEYVKDYIKDLLQKNFRIDENTIDKVIPFHKNELLSIQDKFEILLFVYKKDFGGNAFEEMYDAHHLDEKKENEQGVYYEVTEEDIERAYLEKNPKVSYVDKLEIVAQQIYQNYKGHGVIDELKDQSCLDGISGGVSGLTNSDYNYMDEIISDNKQKGIYRFDSIWILFHGRTIHMSFLSFGTQRELERVCKNIYRYDSPHYLSGQKGYVVTEDKSGSRIVVARPPFSESWKFFVRKFESVKNIAIEELFRDEDCETVIETMKYLVKGGMVIAITGDQASGKTTTLKALIRFIDPTYTLRIEEQVFETWLSKLYPNRNISTFRETATISMQEGIDFQKKTDGDVMILGEIASQQPAALLIQLTQTGTKQTLFTNHAGTVDKLIGYFRNSLLSSGVFQSDSIAEEQVAEAINFDIHMKKSKDGHRYIERITEIIPITDDNAYTGNMKESLLLFFERMSRRKMYRTSDIIVFENGCYVLKNRVSERTMKIMKSNLSYKEADQMDVFFKKHLRHE